MSLAPCRYGRYVTLAMFDALDELRISNTATGSQREKESERLVSRNAIGK